MTIGGPILKLLGEGVYTKRGSVKEKINLYDPKTFKDPTTLYVIEKNDGGTCCLGIDGCPLSPDVGDKIEVNYLDLGSVAKYLLEQRLGRSFNAFGKILKQRTLKPEEAYQ